MGNSNIEPEVKKRTFIFELYENMKNTFCAFKMSFEQINVSAIRKFCSI